MSIFANGITPYAYRGACPGLSGRGDAGGVLDVGEAVDLLRGGLQSPPQFRGPHAYQTVFRLAARMRRSRLITGTPK